MKIQRIRNIAPLLFWLFQIIVLIIRRWPMLGEESFMSIFVPANVTFPLDIVTFCVFYFYFANRFFKQHKTILNGFLAFTYILLYSFVWVLVYHEVGFMDDWTSAWVVYVASIGHSLLNAFYGLFFRLGIDWFEKQQKQKELEKQNVITELALLRSQINPHFLFNTLNNINSFATQNSEKTSFAIIKLSEIMRYMLYEAKEEKVLIEKEISYIENYLALQKLRFKSVNFVKFQCQSDAAGLFIPPMLFIPFIENAFKHGKKIEENGIVIRLQVTNDRIAFECRNQIRVLNETELAEKGGLGLENIKRRLELLYPKNHQLDIVEEDNLFVVKLNINLNEN